MMKSVLTCALLATAAFSASETVPKSVTLLLDPEWPIAPASYQALQDELAGILRTSNIQVSVVQRGDVPIHPEYADVLIFRMKGTCSMIGLSRGLPIGALSDERGPLALTYSVDGQPLSFGEVQCDRVRRSVERTVGRGSPESHQATLGIALARVMAHEMFHMLGRTTEHTHTGVAKATLTSAELSTGRLALSEDACRKLSH